MTFLVRQKNSEKIFSNIPNCFLTLENSFNFFSTVFISQIGTVGKNSKEFSMIRKQYFIFKNIFSEYITNFHSDSSDFQNLILGSSIDGIRTCDIKNTVGNSIRYFLKTNSNGSWQPRSFLMVFFIQCKNCMSVEKISLESGKLSVFKVHFILSVAKLYYYCCELARRVSLGCKWPHITTRDRLFAILASEEKNAFTLPAWKVSMKTKRSKF